MSEFPTTLAAPRHAHAHGLKTIAGAPNVVRGGSHSGNVAAITLAREGVLDGLSSDYVPGSLLQAAWVLHRDAGFSLPEAVRVGSSVIEAGRATLERLGPAVARLARAQGLEAHARAVEARLGRNGGQR